MRRQNKKVIPENVICECECHSGVEVAHDIPCCYVCPRCDENIAAHIYNDHVQTCTRQEAIKAKKRREEVKKAQEIKEQTPPPKKRKRRERIIDFPQVSGSTRSRHRKR